MFYFDLNSTKSLSTYYFFLLSKFHRIFNTFYLNVTLLLLFPKRIYHFFLLPQNINCNNAFKANSKVCFITNNIKSLQSSKKRLKLIEYLKNKLESNGVLFLQETQLFLMTEIPGLLKAKSFFAFAHPIRVVF